MSRSLQFLGTLLALSSVCGCSALDNCPASEKPQKITTGATDLATLNYQSAPWTAPDKFPAKSALWFQHHLGIIPAAPKAYLSFAPHGTNNEGDGSIAESAGNQALIDCFDAHYIVVRNDTCEPSFYIVVTSQGAAPEFEDSPQDPDGCGEMPE